MRSWQSWQGFGVRVVREPELPFPKPSIERPVDALKLLKQGLAWEDREIFAIAILDARNQLIGINTVSVGSLNASLVHPREIFRPAILMGAASIILAHNHPTGDPSPSREDIELTKRLAKAGEILGIEVLDHLIIADTKFLSLKEAGHF